MDRIDTMKAFVTVANEGNFKKAADRLNSSSQLVSKHVSQLEEHLGVRLFNRTTRKVHLTEAGAQCLHHANQILENMQDMEQHLGQMQSEVQGLLNISAPVSFATLHLSPLIREFRKLHPAIGVNLQLNDRKVDLVDEGFDIALRIGYLKNSSLIAKFIAPIRLVVCASPNYLEKHGVPKAPYSLIPEHHLRYSYMEYNQPNVPVLEAFKQSNRIQDRGVECNNGEVLKDAAIAGEGYILQPTFIVGEAVKQGKLSIVLEDFEQEPMALYAVYPHRKLLASKMRVFIDFLSHYFGDPPYWDRF